MAVAYGSFTELSHQLRFLLFEIGIALSQERIDLFISQAHKTVMQHVQTTLCREQVLDKPLSSHHIDDLLSQLHLKANQIKPPHALHPFINWTNLKVTLNELIANLAMSQAYRSYWDNQLAKQIQPCQTLWCCIKKQTPAENLFFLEQWANPIYSSLIMTKVALQFSRRDVLQNLPQFRAKISLHWGALKKTHAYLSASPQIMTALLEKHFPLEYARWQEKLALNHLNSADYLPLPIHPWQWRKHLQAPCAPLIAEKKLMLFPHHQLVMPSSSANQVRAAAYLSPQIELTLTTHAQPSATYSSAPGGRQQLAHWFSVLFAHLPADRHYIKLITHSIELRANAQIRSELLQQQLAVTFRQNPLELLKPGQQLVPFISALTLSPITNSPLLCELISNSGVKPLFYFSQYVHNLLESHLYLVLQHGVSLSIAPEDILLIIVDDKPEGLILKTPDGAAISTHPLFEQTIKTNESDNLECVATLENLFTHFIHHVLQNHLSLWIELLEQYYQLNKEELWANVGQILRHLLTAYNKTIAFEAINQLKLQLFELPWYHPCVLSHYLNRELGTKQFVASTNPLQQSC